MNHAELHAALDGIIRRHARDLSDSGGAPTAAMLDDLTAIADAHRDNGVHDALSARAETTGNAPTRRRTKGNAEVTT